MNNKLTLWYEIEKKQAVIDEVKSNIQQRYGFSDSEFETTEDGFKFLYDDETNGEIAIKYSEDNKGFKVAVEGTWPWEVLEIYDHCLPQSALLDPV